MLLCPGKNLIWVQTSHNQLTVQRNLFWEENYAHTLSSFQLDKTDCKVWPAASPTKGTCTSKDTHTCMLPSTNMKVSLDNHNYSVFTPDFHSGLLLTTGTTTFQLAFLSQISPLLETPSHLVPSWLHLQLCAIP